jgi:predicted regulator of Ras-like GTPase activity (Roadblock/LC7/MglB family)
MVAPFLDAFDANRVTDEALPATLLRVEVADVEGAVVMGLFGLIATTKAGSVATAAVLAALTAAVLVPSLILVV